MIAEAAAAGAAFVQTPEVTNLCERDTKRLRETSQSEAQHEVLAGLRQAAREAKIWLQIGSLSVRAGEKIANRAYMIDPAGEIAARYDKVHLFDVDLPNGETWRESNTFAGGDKATLVETPFGLVGMSICYDVRFPYLYRAEAEADAVILTAPACFTRQTGEAHWQVLQRARAIENGAFMAMSNFNQIPDITRDQERSEKALVALQELIDRYPKSEYVSDARQRIPTLRHTRSFTVDVRLAGQPRLDAAE